jgi:D-lyxose ketol-isomerase
VRNTDIACIEASVGPKDNKQKHDTRQQFPLELLSSIEEEETYLHKLCSSNEAMFNDHG